MEVYLRFDPATEEAVLEDEYGTEVKQLERTFDGAFYLFGPFSVEDISEV